MISPAHTHRGIRKKGNNSRQRRWCLVSPNMVRGEPPWRRERRTSGTSPPARAKKVPAARDCLAWDAWTCVTHLTAPPGRWFNDTPAGGGLRGLYPGRRPGKNIWEMFSSSGLWARPVIDGSPRWGDQRVSSAFPPVVPCHAVVSR